MKKLSPAITVCLALALCTMTAVFSSAQNLTTIANFNGGNGYNPQASLVQGTDGNFYGTTSGGPAPLLGTVFKVTPAGSLITLHKFCAGPSCEDGGSPLAGLIQATNGIFYGTTSGFGAHGGGTLFQITSEGDLTVLYNFCAQADCVDGSAPRAPLLQAPNGNLYGTTSQGGLNNGGTVFEITPAGTLTTIYNFCSVADCADGSSPAAALIQATNGSFYGTTDGGTIFKLTQGGVLTTLSNIGITPGFTFGGLVQGADGNFYGTTPGDNDYGTVFKMSQGGTLTTLHAFSGTEDGANPVAGLVQGNDGNFYGITLEGGSGIDGTVFRITPSGTLTTLINFNQANGGFPEAAVIQGTDGNLYGTTDEGGADNAGTAFKLAVGLKPFVATRPTVGPVGTSVIILGNNLTSTTAVTFNGTPATFTVVSSTEVTATVPAGSTTGTLEVTTGTGTLDSNVAFRVLAP
jgi:uncharacterized repeat protein (TIGR03803 family)